MENAEARVRSNFERQKFMKLLGAELIAVRPGQVEIRLPFRDDLTQQHDYTHAGVIASILDSACGYAALSMAPEARDVLSVEFKLNLLAPAVGDEFIARAQVRRSGKTITVSAGDAFARKGSEEKLIATMLATIISVERGQG